MNWKVSNVMDERIKFVARMLEVEKMAGLCREFGISRKTGYKIWERYKECGLEGLQNRSRRSYRHANQLPFQIERAILQLKQEYPSWGAPKIREKLLRRYPLTHPPATSIIHAVLDRNGLVNKNQGDIKLKELNYMMPYAPINYGAQIIRENLGLETINIAIL